MQNLHHLSPEALAGLAEHAQSVANYCVDMAAQAVEEIDRQMYWDRAMNEQAAADAYKAALALR